MWGARTSSGGLIVASWAQIAGFVRKSDIVLLVLDARDPCNTFCRKLVSIANDLNKKLIVVLNRCDLVPKEVIREWKNFFELSGYLTVYTAATRNIGTHRLKRTIKGVAPSLPTVVTVVGYPKVGKSSIINALKNRRSASTSPYPGSPGYTKRFQVYRVDEDILLIDTPGILPVEGDPLVKILRGFPPGKIPDPVNPAIMLIQRILEFNPNAFIQLYGIESTEPTRVLEELALYRGWLYKRTGEPDIEEAARAVIRDYHDGKLSFYIRPSEVNCDIGGSTYDQGKGTRS